MTSPAKRTSGRPLSKKAINRNKKARASYTDGRSQKHSQSCNKESEIVHEKITEPEKDIAELDLLNSDRTEMQR